MGKEDDAKQEEDAFAAENIDQILAGRTEKRQIGSRKGNTFSTATFSSNEVRLMHLSLQTMACSLQFYHTVLAVRLQVPAADKNNSKPWTQLMHDIRCIL